MTTWDIDKSSVRLDAASTAVGVPVQTAADRMYTHGFLDNTRQVRQLAQVSIVWGPGVRVFWSSQQALLPQLFRNFCVDLQKPMSSVSAQAAANL